VVTLKYECIYLHEMDDGFIAKRHIHNWISFYNNQRPHSTFNGRTPDEVYGLDGNEKDEKLAA